MGGAGNGIRTRDTELGKLVLYQLSYARPHSLLSNDPYGMSSFSRVWLPKNIHLVVGSFGSSRNLP